MVVDRRISKNRFRAGRRASKETVVLLPINGRYRRPVPRGTALWSHAEAPLAPSHGRGRPRALRAALLASSALLLAGLPAAAQNATWNFTGTRDFNTAGNWTPATVPTDTAFFGVSTQNSGVSFSANTTIGGWTFNSGASAYSFANVNDLAFTGAGIVINGGSASITSGGSLEFFNTSTAGSATITNNNVLAFFITSTAGSAFITNNGTMGFVDTSTAGSATITNNGSVGFANTSTAGSATITNNNVLAFFITSTAGNATITNNNSLNFNANSTAGSASITNNGGGFLGFNNSSTAGNASITNNGGATATIQFFNTSTAGNATITNNRTLSFSDSSTAGNASLVNNAVVDFFNTTTAGNATITNNAFMAFHDTSTAGDATLINNSGLGFGNASTAGNATITTNSGGTTIIGTSASGGTARFILNGTGALDISGLTTGGTTAGSVEGGGNVFLGAKILTVGDNNLSTTFSGVIQDGGFAGGTGGSLFKVGTGTLTLTGTNTYTGGTTIDAGAALQVGNGGAGGSIVGNVADAGTLIFNRSDSYTFVGAITGAGALAQNGSGTTILTGTSTYIGPTMVNGGTLSVNGSIASSNVTVNPGGTLGGNGTVGNTTINGGALAPGNSIGLLTVQGSLVFTAASSYMVEVSPANADRVNVTGAATLGGATVNASFAAGTYVAKQYTILNATGGVSGTFGAEVNTNLPANFHTSLSYDANNAYLNLLLTFAVPTGLNANQQNVGNVLTNFFNTTGGIPLVFGALTPAGLTQASGELATGSQQTTFDAMNLFMGLLTDPFIAGRGDGVTGGAGAPQFAEENDSASAYAANGKPRSKSERDAYAAIYRKAPPIADTFAQRWSVWAAGFGGSQSTDGNAALGSNNTNSRIAGAAVGADYRFSPFTLAGFALAGGGTNFSIANGLGTGRSDLFQAGAFVRHTVGPAYISGALAYGWQDITTNRTVTIAGIDQLQARFNANAFSGRAEGGYRFVSPWIGGIGIAPYAAAQFTTFDLPAYAEQALIGTNNFALAYGAKSVTDPRSELGFRTDKSFAMPDGVLTLRGRLAWAHDFDPDRSIAATFQALPGASFVVNGAAQASDSALTTASIEMKWKNGWSAAATFEGEFSDVTSSYAGKGVVRYAW
jgi:autotransporter-associated beta strand protein